MINEGRSYGWAVAWSAFVLAVFAWGTGFYGPAVYMQAIHSTHHLQLSQIASAVTFHFLLSAGLIAYLPEIHARLGIARTTWLGAVATALGLLGWAMASQSWHLFLAAVPTAVGWAVTSGAAINAIVAPWFDRDRPKAIGLAFNGASVGGVVFVPLWIFLIDRWGFPVAAIAVGASMVAAVSGLAVTTLRANPPGTAVRAEGVRARSGSAAHGPRPMSRTGLMRDVRFLTISIAFALGLFAQIGFLAHLLVRLSPEVGVAVAGFMISIATVCAVIGRTLLGWMIGDRDRRHAAAVNFAVQIVGVCFLVFGSGWLLLGLGCVFFGLGIGNLVSLPPLIVQKEFDRVDVPLAVALIVAINQAVFAFAPAIFGVIRDVMTDYSVPFLLAGVAQFCAAAIILIGRSAPKTDEVAR